MKRVSFVVMMALAIAGAPSAFAQQAQGGGSTNVTQPQGSGQGQGQGRQPATTVSGQQGFGSWMTNVRLDLTITDQTTANATPIKKVISMLLAERGSGRVRSNSVVEVPGGPAYQVVLNADANVSRIEGERIRIGVTVEYAPAAPDAAKAGSRGSPLNQTVEVVLANGKPTVIVQSSDPLTDRKVTLEATATIVR